MSEGPSPLGTLYGVGVGPGDPELLTLKALRLIQAAPVIAYPLTDKGVCLARNIVARYLTEEQRELPLPMPLKLNRAPANRAYDEAAALLRAELKAGNDAVVLCEGDPFFFGSFIHLYERLKAFPCEIVPGVTSLSAAAAVSGTPPVSLDERLAVISGRNEDTTIAKTLRDYDSVAILKVGRHRPRLLELLRNSGRWESTVYVEQATWEGQRVCLTLDEVENSPGPYWSLFLTTRRRRPCSR